MLFLASVAGSFAGAAQPVGASLGRDAEACAPSSPHTAILVELDGLKDRSGQVRVELYSDRADEFLTDDVILEKKGAVFRRVELATPEVGPVQICIKAPGTGRYAMAVIHSRSGTRKFSFWSDGVGFPNIPKLGWSKPKVEAATIELRGGVQRLQVTLNYKRGLSFRPLRSAKS